MYLKVYVGITLLVLAQCEDEKTQGDSVANFEMYDCETLTNNCTSKICEDKSCHCNESNGYYYNKTSKECQFNIQILLNTTVEKYNTKEKVLKESMKTFRGIEISGFIAIVCASLGFVAGCYYCFRIKYIDGKLKNQVNALSKLKKPVKADQAAQRQLLPIEESCNVVEEAGLFVV